ncbi:MAG: hypothetical protein Q9215_002212 [Flavoplaca cf. flavocitrina]
MTALRPFRATYANSSSRFLRQVSSHAPSNLAIADYESLLSYHWDTVAPTPKQRRHAEHFFLRGTPKILYSSSTFRKVPRGQVPEVAFLGRSNVGKSSLLNKLVNKNICHTSKNPGRTKTMNFFAVGGEDEQGNPGRLVVLDMPGYGHKSRAEWGEEIMKYLVGRKQYVFSGGFGDETLLLNRTRLVRAFVLIDSMHGVKRSDESLLQALRESAISHQVVLSKVDRILFPRSRNPTQQMLQRNATNLQQAAQSIRDGLASMDVAGPEALGEILACSTAASLERGKWLGINNLRWAVLAATGLNETRKRPMLIDADSGRDVALEAMPEATECR